MEKNTEIKENKIQNATEGKKMVGIILISIGIIIFLSSFVWYPAFVVSAIILAAVVALGMSFEFLRIFYYSKPDIKRFMATIYMPFYCYLSVFLFSLLMISNNKANVLFILILAPAGFADAAASYIGKKIGKRKMAKRISPGKTWEGAIGGYIVSFIVTLIILGVLKFFCFDLEIQQIMIISFLLPLLAILGDLVGSAYKRIMGVKDSGNVLKGHGGFLDRTVSFLLPIYAVYLWAFWFLS